MSAAKTIFKRLFRVYAHMYHSHFRVFTALGCEAHLNICFKRFAFFVIEHADHLRAMERTRYSTNQHPLARGGSVHDGRVVEIAGSRFQESRLQRHRRPRVAGCSARTRGGHEQRIHPHKAINGAAPGTC